VNILHLVKIGISIATVIIIIAASIIMGRGLAPLESAIGGWRGFLQAREAWRRLVRALGEAATTPEAMPLPAPKGAVVFDKASAAPPESRKMTLQDVSFTLEAGTCLGITGPSGAGKSTLARLLVGVWRPITGTVRLDGVNVADWRREELGPHLGYLPQDIELFPGTVAQNIARFGEIDSSKVVEAAQLAGAHTMILALPKGYDTPIGPAGENLSGGQRQRIGLARAFYGRPPLVLLDEPTSNLDAEGEAAVRQAMDSLRAQGGTVIVIAHRPAVLGGTDKLMVVMGGTVASFGPTCEVMPAITRRVMGQPGGTTLAVNGRPEAQHG
jgi:PrtD family type I secretion system ABC transporter